MDRHSSVLCKSSYVYLGPFCANISGAQFLSRFGTRKWNKDNESQTGTPLRGPAAHTCEPLPTAGLLCSQLLPSLAYYFHYEYK